jgi:hypothetical protein
MRLRYVVCERAQHFGTDVCEPAASGNIVLGQRGKGEQRSEASDASTRICPKMKLSSRNQMGPECVEGEPLNGRAT